ncbi:hypothetical protein Hanom_Chr02g00113421 [Helianthus anomalus]
MASKDLRLPDKVSSMAKLGADLKPMTVRLLHLPEQEEFPTLPGVKREEKVGVMRYANGPDS